MNWAGGRTATAASISTSRPTSNSAAENVLAVRLTPEEQSSRWYPGAGIYRNVWLVITGPVHVAHWGTYVTTPEVTDDCATVVREERDPQPQRGRRDVDVETAILDAEGKQVGRGSRRS